MPWTTSVVSMSQVGPGPSLQRASTPLHPKGTLGCCSFVSAGRYLVLLYYNPFKMQAKVDAKVKRDDIERLKKKLLAANGLQPNIGFRRRCEVLASS